MLSPRSLSAGVAVAAAAALALGPVGGAGAASRACTAEDLEGTRAPAMLRDHGLDTQEEPLVAGTRYRVVVVQELAIGDRSQPVDGSIAVSAPDGPALEQSTEDRRPVYDFAPPRAGTVRLVVSWEAEVGSPGSGDICSASQTFDLPVLEPTAPKIEGRFHPGPRTFESSFTLRLRGKRPQDPGKVRVIVRARRGTTKPPPPRGPALARFTFDPNGSGGFDVSGATREVRRTFYADHTGSTVSLYPYPNIPFGRTLRFAFSLEVTQNGKRLGGMRSGARCRRIQFRGHSAVKCRPVGLKQRP
jgi:hypothetical protein